MSVYLDYNASAPIDSRVIDIMVDVYRNNIGNADSRTHDYGENSRRVVEDARNKVANLIGVSVGEIFFTSGATESNNIAIQGLREYANATGKKHIITTSIEHKAVLETVKAMEKEGFDVELVSPDISGKISADEILSKVREDTLLVSVMHVNNETGIIQPVKVIGDALSDKDVFFHIDATQSCGKLVKEIRDLKYNMLSFSAHKLMGPQGIGVLVLKKKRYKLPPVKNIIYGGLQEHGIRPGTLPVALIAGCGKACEIAESEYQKNNDKNKKLKERILSEISQSGIDYIINGDQEECIDNTINISFLGVSSEALMLSTKNFCGISNGSACTSKSYAPSYVLIAMGIPEDQIECSIRVSWGSHTDEDEAVNAIKSLIAMAKQLRI